MILTYEQRALIMKLRRTSEASAEAIASAIGCSSSAVRRCAAKGGLPFTAQGKKSRGKEGPLSEERKEAIRQGVLRQRSDA